MLEFVLSPLTSLEQEEGIGISPLKITCIVHNICCTGASISIYFPWPLHRPFQPRPLALIHTKTPLTCTLDGVAPLVSLLSAIRYHYLATSPIVAREQRLTGDSGDNQFLHSANLLHTCRYNRLMRYGV